MKLNEALEEKKFDVRLQDKLLADGKLSSANLHTYLDDLADDTEKATYVNLAQEEVATDEAETEAETETDTAEETLG